ncbi:Oidioi.mRNA.OKI2018_I69.chr1.g468.t1.cds [Oikopleura dioica]|uniref:Oidioi.mRNA.OKI2018_I69.chr1.g468.t1.cds n=1 Tax=Oikopleura dioica TaxID=34765 RepID=A0ABN7SPC5_OIKDI|nr:Oidioi.mRNA.OKI2018_I69.chr1.g468.t1.cds [Oikopleura dioica]
MKLLPILTVAARKSSREPDPRSESYPRDLAQFRQEEKREQFRALISGDLQCIPEENRIIGGQFAGALTWRWHAFLPQLFCGATVLDSRTVLTAGHCCYKFEGQYSTGDLVDRYDVEVGMVNLNDLPGDNPGNAHRKLYRAQRFVRHPDYREDSESAENDVCLIFTRKPISMNNGVAPACLPDDGIPDPDVDLSAEAPPVCFTAGFGKYDYNVQQLSSKLKEMKANIYDVDQCNEKFEDVWGYGIREESEICAGDISGTNSTCSGDSGSSLICIENDMPVIRGVTSWGVDGCRRAGFPGVFARTSNFLDWIKDEQRKFKMEANGQDICDEGLASDCYNGCVKSHIPNWGSNGIMGTPIKGGSWECTEGANTCSYICDEGSQDTGITTRCDGGEWRVPNNRQLKYGDCRRCNRRDWDFEVKEIEKKTDLKFVCNLSDNTEVECTIWCPTKATGYKLNCDRKIRLSDDSWSRNNWNPEDLWTDEEGLKINCDDDSFPAPPGEPEVPTGPDGPSGPDGPEEPKNPCGPVPHPTVGGEWICGEENGRETCHHTCPGGIRTDIVTTCMESGWSGVSKGVIKKASCEKCVLSDLLADHPTDGEWDCTNDGTSVVCSLDCSNTEHSPEDVSKFVCERKKGKTILIGAQRCDAPPVVLPECDVASLEEYLKGKYPDYVFDEADWNLSKLDSSGKIAHNCAKNKGKCKVKKGKVSWNVKVKGDLSCA